MTKIFIIIISFFFTTNIVGQTMTGGFKLMIEERIKDGNGRRPVINESINVVLNDSLTFNLTTDNEGYVVIKDRPKGYYNVKIVRAGCQAQEIKKIIIIGEGKTAYVTFLLTCASYINSLTKKEKKQLGYK